MLAKQAFLLIGIPLFLCSCTAIKKNAAKLGIGKDPDAKKKEKPKMLRPANVQGILPSSDKATHAAKKLHLQLHPDESGSRILAAIPGDSGSVKIYMDDAKPGAKPVNYWVCRLPDGKWRAYKELPRKENFAFIFKELSRAFLTNKKKSRIQIHDFKLIETSENEREVRIRFSVLGKVDTRKLTFLKNEKEGWAITTDTSIERVY